MTVQNAEIVHSMTLCTSKPIAGFRCRPNHTVKCSAFLSSFGTKISHVVSFGPLPNTSCVECRPAAASVGCK